MNTAPIVQKVWSFCTTLRDDGFSKVREGRTTVEEVLREAVILASLILHPGLIHRFESALERLDLTGEDHNRLRALLLAHADENPASLDDILRVEAGAALDALMRRPHVQIAPPVRNRTDVDLAIQDEERMAHLCHFVMIHTATSLHLAQIGQPTKKQYSLKAGLKRFGARGDSAVTKELSQLHTLNCFRPRDPHTLTREDHRNALTSLMFLTEKRTGEVKARACANRKW